jgi:hypothetical protein
VLKRLAVATAFSVVLVLIFRAAPAPPPQSALVGSMGRGPTVVLVHGLGSDVSTGAGRT